MFPLSHAGRVAGALALLLAAAALPAHAATRFEDYCAKPGLARSVRQTIVIIDEAHVVPNPAHGGIAPQNAAWTRFVGDLINNDRIQQGRIFAPRERLTVLMAPRNGAEPRLLFTGCVPYYSAAEKASLARQAGGLGSMVNSYFGSGPVQAAVKDMDRFRTQLGAALIAAAAPGAVTRGGAISGPFASSALYASLQRTPVDIGQGIPRIILYSNVNRFTPAAGNVVGARKAGFDLARRDPADFKRAEVYVVGAAPTQSELDREFFKAWLLGSGGWLRGLTTAGLAQMDAYPERLRVFSGVIRYGDLNAPMRLRLATTASGEIVNSWISVQNETETATPFSGNVVDVGGGAQRGGNNGQGLGQLWSFNPDEKPEFSGDLPLGGMRRLEFTTDRAGGLNGKVSDPLVGAIQGSRTPYIDFRLALTRAMF